MNVSKLTEKYFFYNEPIGYGSFSIIYKGYNTHSHNLIAIKQITKIIDKRYFNNEVALMKNLDHPNILKLYDVIRKKDTIYLILEYCNCGDLSQYIASSENKNNIKYLYNILFGLEYLYKNRILHRDVKPHNILIHNGLIKISDFGFAKAFEKNELITTFCGSPLYMAPEIIKNKEYNSKSDIWSLGVIIFELFTKKHPYYTESKNILWEKIKNGIIVDYLNIDYPEIVEILKKMLIDDPKLRIDWDGLFNYNSIIKNLYIDNYDNDNDNDMIFDMEDLSYNKSITHSVIIPKQKPNMIAYSIDYREFNKSSFIETEDYTVFSRSAPNMGKSYMENYINKKTKEDYKDSIPILGSEPEVKHPISSMLDKSYRVFENMFKW
jgi:serine/threonine protein kinase